MSKSQIISNFPTIVTADANGNIANINVGNLNLTGNAEAAYYLGNGYYLTGLPAQYSNANVANYLPTYTGNISGGNLALTDNITANIVLVNNIGAIGFLSGNNITGNSLNILGDGLIGNGGTGNLTVFGNATANYYLGNGAFLTGLPATYSNADVANYLPTYTGNLASLTGNVTTTANVSGAYILGNITQATGYYVYGNSNVADYLPAYTGNLASLTGNVTTTANISANYILGNGAFITGLPAGYSNADVANYLPTYTGNLASLTGNVTTIANISANYILGNITQATGYYVYGNSNVADYLPTYTGNLSAGNANITGQLDLANIGQLKVPGGTFGQFVQTDGQGNLSYSSAISLADPTFQNTVPIATTTSNTTVNGATQIRVNGLRTDDFVKDVLFSFSNGAAGYNNYYTVTSNSFYNGAETLIDFAPPITGGAYATASTVYVTGVKLPYNVITFTGGVTAAVTAGGALQVDVAGAYSNANVAAYLPTYTGNLASLTGNVITTANISAGNISLTGNIDALNVTGAFTTNTSNTVGNAQVGNFTVRGDAIVLGNVSIEGTLTTVNSNTITINDKSITLANNATTPSEANGAGIDINGANVTFQYDVISNSMILSHTLQSANLIVSQGNLDATGNINVTNNVLVSGNIIVAGYSNVNGNLNALSNLNVTSNAYFSSNSFHTGNANFSANIYALSNLIVTNNAYFSSNTFTSGNVYALGNLSVGANTTIGSNLSVLNTLFVGTTSNNTTFINPIIIGRGNASGYNQFAILNDLGTASSDLVAYADNGSDAGSWADMGFTGSTFSDGNYTITKPNDGYFFTQGNTIFGGNMVLATGPLGTYKDIIFAAGGFQSTNERLRFVNNSNVFVPISNTTISLGNANRYFNNVYSSNTYVLSNVYVGNSTLNNSYVIIGSANTANSGLLIQRAGTERWAVIADNSSIQGNLVIRGNGTTNVATFQSNAQAAFPGQLQVFGNLTTIGLNTDYIIANGANITNQTIAFGLDQYSASEFRTSKYIVQASANTGAVESREILVVNNGTTAVLTSYGIVYTGTGPLVTYDASIAGGLVQVTGTILSSATSVSLRVIPTYIRV